MSRVILPFKTSPLVFPGRKAGFDSSHFAAKGCFWSVVSTGASAVNLCKPSPKPTAQVSAPTRVIDGALGIASKFTGVTSNSLVFTGGSKAQVDLAFTYACFYRPATVASNTSIVSNSTTVNTGSLLSYNTGNACLILGSELVAPMLSGINLIVGVPYFIVASATGPSASTSTWSHNWVVVRLDTGQITTSTGTSSQSWAASNGNMLFGGASSGQGNLDADGNLAAAMYSNVFTSVPQMLQWAQDPWAFWYPRTLDLATMLSAGSGSTAYTLAGNEGAFTIGGQAATFAAARKLANTEGAYVVNGQAATLKLGRALSGVEGAYVVSGQAATELRGIKLNGVEGAFVINGQAATLTLTTSGHFTLAGNEGIYTVSGQAAALNKSLKVSGVEGAFTVNGQAAAAIKALHLAGVEGAFVVNGQPATTSAARKLAGVEGAFVINGQAATLRHGLHLAGIGGVFTVNGSSAGFGVALSMKGVEGTFLINGKNASLVYTPFGAAKVPHNLEFFATMGRLRSF